jgi:hypothetical protein
LYSRDKFTYIIGDIYLSKYYKWKKKIILKEEKYKQLENQAKTRKNKTKKLHLLLFYVKGGYTISIYYLILYAI